MSVNVAVAVAVRVAVGDAVAVLVGRGVCVLVALGDALVASGRTNAGLDTLKLAVREGWDVSLFRHVAEIERSTGDTAGALRLLAMVAADPATSQPRQVGVRPRHRGCEVQPAQVGTEPGPDAPRQVVVAVDERMAAQQRACSGEMNGASKLMPTFAGTVTWRRLT